MTEVVGVTAVPQGLEAPRIAEEQPVTDSDVEGAARRAGRLSRFMANDHPQQRGLSAAIPPVDPQALQDLAAFAVRVATQADELLRSVHSRLQALTALSVGCIQTYRDGVESLGEAVDTSIRSMYTLMARCEELERELRPVPDLAERIRELKSALERLEGLCK